MTPILILLLAAAAAFIGIDYVRGHARLESKRDDAERFLKSASMEGMAPFLDGLEKFPRGRFDPFTWFDSIQQIFNDPGRRQEALYSIVAAQLPKLLGNSDYRIRIASLLLRLGFRLVREKIDDIDIDPAEMRRVQTDHQEQRLIVKVRETVEVAEPRA